MLTEKDNWRLLLKGEMPEFLPTYNLFGWRSDCSLFFERRVNNGPGIDIYGVEYIGTKEAGGAAMPAPGKFLLTDIRKWRDVIKTPDWSNVDWDALAKKDLANKDLKNNPNYIAAGSNFFQLLINFMGFTEGLCAMYEEPDEVLELYDYLAKFYIELEKKLIKHYQADVYIINDDNSTAMNPFIAPELYRKLIKPYHKMQADLALNNGIFVQMHDCGHCEVFIDDWLEMGVTMWDPAQVMNDLVGIKKKYGRKLALCGCWDSSGPASWLTTDDKVLKDALVDYVDTFAPGGAFCFGANIMGSFDDEVFKRKMKIIHDFYQDYARNWYQTHK